ncbi:hypothetical protein PAXRUDRAFT_35943 [Paxillus rubicundulus Ve08.2h10]|uniref:Uncharacterized protein n=1 Tax=Paxillus rubicundulus Ve08.2h10 TaxID=930991 RepID=A0A0D0CZR3_9AGAM|nr:hypothetical protein PAXRUDRAFT_35943 [Paxillus rubicundulus Ve08.2h10]
MTMSLDWFGQKTSVYRPSHSSGVLSLYRAKNLLILFMTPGPTEPTGLQLQNYLKVVVDNLLELYTHRVCRLVRVMLLGVICDHPAMCKMSGFADHGHTTAPCLKCYVDQDHIFSNASLRNEFPGRKGEDHQKCCYEENDLPSEAQCATFFKEHGARWTELACLPYFNLVRQTIIDPMHNLLLGIVKTQWYSQWIQTPALRASTDKCARELDVIHCFLASFHDHCSQFKTLLWAGKLPTRVGEPAGGSLTADEYKFSACSAWPIIIPVVWDRFIDEAKHDFATANTQQHKALAKYLKDHKTWKKNSEMSVSTSTQKKGRKKTEGAELVPPKLPKLRMQREEPINLLHLSVALQIFCGSSIKLDMLPQAQQLLQEYLLEFKRLYGISIMKPNFHWAVHLTQQIQDFGPVYNFWAFLSERLNKVLKSSNSNNWTGGQFCQGAQMDAIVRCLNPFAFHLQFTSWQAQSVLLSPDNNVVKVMMQCMLNEGDEALGTVQDAATELNDLNAYLHIQAGPIVGIKPLSDHAHVALHAIYNGSGVKVHYHLETPSSVLSRHSAGSSIVWVIWNEDEWYGEVINILSHTQDHIASDPKILAEIRYMKELQLSPVPDDPWSDFPELDIRCFSMNEYWEPTEGGSPPRLMPVDLIECQIARGVIDSTVPPLWITTTMDRVSLVLHPKITS